MPACVGGARPQTTVFGDDAYPDVYTKAGAFMHSLARNHAFIDRNKRTAWLSAGAFYWINGYLLDAPDDPAYHLGIAVAAGEIDVPEIAGVLSGWAHPRGSRPRLSRPGGPGIRPWRSGPTAPA
jgi:death on curing protein